MNNENSSQLLAGRELSQENIHPLTIGDKIPDLEFDNVINYPTKTAQLSDFKSKLTILDFWSSSCSSCIGLFPHLQALKDTFKTDLQIVLVNGQTRIWHDNPAKVNRLLVSLKDRTGRDIRLPVVLNCEELDHYFPYRVLPQEVWINDKEVVIAITGAEEVTASNIKAILEGKKASMHLKNDINFDLQTHPLSELIYGTTSSPAKPLSSSVLVKGIIDGLGAGMGVRHADSPFNKLYTGWYVFNLPLLDIYRLAYRDQIKFPSNRVFIEAHDATRFQQMETDDTSMYSNVYSYDITVPHTTFENLTVYVQNDLERTFHANVINERRKIKCFVLKATPKSVKSYTKGGKKEYRMEQLDAKKYVRNYPLSELILNLNANYFKTPLVDETGLTRHIDIDMPYDLSEQNIILALEKAGFAVKEEEREMEVAVIMDK